LPLPKRRPVATAVAGDHEPKWQESDVAMMESDIKGLLVILDESPIGVSVSRRRDGVVVYANLRFTELIGIPKDQFVGTKARGYYVDENQRRLVVDALQRDGRVDDFDVQFRRSDGTAFWTLLTIRPAVLDDENVNLAWIYDIDERKRNERSLQDSRTLLRKLSMAVEQAPVTVVITDAKGDIEYVNKAFSDVSGYASEEVIGQNPRILKSDQVPESTFTDLWKTITAGRPWQGELCNKKKDGSLFWEAVTIAPVKNEDEVITSYLAVKENITQRKDFETKLVHQATHDALTGLPNRLLLQDRLSHAIEVARREQSKVAVMFIDLDRFKVVNDSLGHEVGDRLLVVVAERLRLCLRRSDTIARLGGDEFVVVLTSFQGTGEIVDVAEKIIARIDEPMMLDGYKVHVGASIGVAFFPDDGDDVTSLMRDADGAMYRAKNAGRNTFRFFDTAMNGEAIERLNLEASLRRALEAEEFELYYQPKLSLETQEVMGVEALIRWNSPERGLVSPVVFIPLAEETGLITQIGDWVLNEACRQLALWRDCGKELLSVAVNISARQFLDPDLAEKIGRLLLKFDLPPTLLEVELTESTVMADPEVAICQLVRLREIGIHVSVDDFGTGYSSLSYLKRLPLSTIKVDRSFVHCVDRQSDNAAIVAAILGLGDALGMSIVAEGVETDGEERYLQTAGCATVQGFKYAKPLPAAEFEQWLEAFGKAPALRFNAPAS
jgi:diguanylate cyclase (GGDEF)-like protein/PAS domain S-box-containing protein